MRSVVLLLVSLSPLAAMGACGGGTATTSDGGDDAQQQPETSASDASNDVVSDAGQLDTGADAGPATPDAIFASKLVLWLDADEATTVITDADAGSRVVAWNDRSSYANNAKVIYSSPTSHIDVQKQAVNGRTALRLPGNFAATGLFDVPDTISLQWSTGDFMIAMVVAYNNTPGTDEYGGRGQLWGKSSGGWPYWGPGMAANAYSAPLPDGGVGGADSVIFAGIESFAAGPAAGAWSSKDGWNDGNFHAFGSRKDTAYKTMYVRTDGQETSSTQNIDTTQNLSGFGTDVQIGGYVSGNTCCYSPLKGYIAEIIAVKGSSGTPGELTQLGAYIKAKYGLTF